MRLLSAPLVALTLTTGLFATAAPSPATALDRRVLVINRSHNTIVELYGSNKDRNGWEEDVLGADVIPPGGRVTVNFNDGSGYCVFDLKAVMDTGAEMLQWNADVCTVDTWTIDD